jgi:anti-sigma B factor antagonist
LVEALVWPVVVEMPGVLSEDGGGMPFVVDQHLVGALRADAAHESLRASPYRRLANNGPSPDFTAAAGAVDLATAPTLHNAVTATLADGPSRAIIDLSDVDFLTSVGLTILGKARRDAARHTAVRVVATGTARRAITLTGLDDLLSTHPTLADALDSQ